MNKTVYANLIFLFFAYNDFFSFLFFISYFDI